VVDGFRFDPVELPENTPALREEVRAFLDQELKGHTARQRANCWAVFDPDFSQKLGERGYLGMVWPKRYGGHERGELERYIVLEELLAAGAPVGAHWVADRQHGMSLIRFGNEAQRERWIPGMANGTIYSCIGMSEPNAGSDLAGVRTRATKVDGGWLLNGQKIWSTHARRCQLMVALVRTGLDETNRRNGLTQFLIELDTPGIRIRPIVDLAGDSDFDEVFFDDVFLPDAAMLGDEGSGWNQVTGELSLERSGPERYLSSHAVFIELLRFVGSDPSPELRSLIGKLSAQLWTLREMSLSVAGQLVHGRSPTLEAAVVKDLGNEFEQAMPRLIQATIDADVALEGDEEFTKVLSFLLMVSPSFSLRGGTREILRGIVARGLGLR
jgi:alkylation response protein AidB-like acyl-CoA dehydrogenase